ncbi:enoyl-CoA hydratase/isomerase family protein [Leekyejoonella antrihumi]|uniref:Enoyl-CoA hydratase/isomerase family protein n=1 Tax=Leekyejoonella antrihumi TaxID=1660198 RepID=A0A563DUF1_9MICO|nr:enoyl-CoA hydratase/isomerase family protein [Leekyejoonella antrihumi]TWP33806.1 enoyl-CoA hydratase/isomerase family protein [Leekyejoonella antrihumi]
MTRIVVDRNSPVATVTVGDGLRRNALGQSDWRDLTAEIRALDADPRPRVVVITGRDQTFSAGSDLTEWVGADLPDVERSFQAMEDCFQAIERASIPVIAAVEGTAAGAGCQLALACDVAVVSASAKLGMPIVRLGILASDAFVERLSARIGAALTADLYLTGRLLRADEAQAAGLVARVAPPGTTLAAALDIATGLQQQPPAAVNAAKSMMLAVTRHPSPGRDRAPTVDFDTFRNQINAFFARGSTRPVLNGSIPS